MEKSHSPKTPTNLTDHALDHAEEGGQSMSPPAFQLKASTFGAEGDPSDPDGQALPLQMKEAPDATGTVMQKMENAFGADFSTVQLHPDSSEATAADSLAFTQGEQIHFAPGQFRPETQSGQQLLGHELAHVVQQRKGDVPVTREHNGFAINDDPALEQEADVLGNKAAAGQVIQSKSPVLQRQATGRGPIQRQPIVRRIRLERNRPGQLTVHPSFRLFDGHGHCIQEGGHSRFASGRTTIDVQRGTSGVLQLRARIRVVEEAGNPSRSYNTSAYQNYRYSFDESGNLVLRPSGGVQSEMAPASGATELRYQGGVLGAQAGIRMDLWARYVNEVTAHREGTETRRTDYNSGTDTTTSEHNAGVNLGARGQGSGRAQSGQSAEGGGEGGSGGVQTEEEVSGGLSGLFGGAYRYRRNTTTSDRRGYDQNTTDSESDTTTTSREWRDTGVHPEIFAQLRPVGSRVIDLAEVNIRGARPIYTHYFATGRHRVNNPGAVQDAVLRQLSRQQLDDMAHGRAYLSVEGYADLQGSERNNMRLSDRRARAVRSALRGLGLEVRQDRFPVETGVPTGDRGHAEETNDNESADPEWRSACVYFRYSADEAAPSE